MAYTPLPPGAVLSKRYKIIHLIRKGGMGATYRGEDLEIRKPVAIKQLLDNFESPEERESGISNFLTEMALLKSIEHPRIPKILDHFIAENGFFFVLEFVEGSDFTRILDDTGRAGLPEEEVIHAGIHLCRILSYLHNRKPEPIIHHDIKSSNVMKRSKDSRIMLLDFGIARAQKPKEGMMIGTPGYASPEQHARNSDIRSDIFSLGATLHEMASGQRPSPKGFEFLPLSQLRPELSPGFSDVILTATRYFPHERFQDAAAFEEALQNLLASPLPKEEDNSLRESLRRFQSEILSPALSKLKDLYPNECQSETSPLALDHFSFILGVQVPHSLTLDVDEQHQTVVFHVKEGLLPSKLLGEISPDDPNAEAKLAGILARFEHAYTDTGDTSGSVP